MAASIEEDVSLDNNDIEDGDDNRGGSYILPNFMPAARDIMRRFPRRPKAAGAATEAPGSRLLRDLRHPYDIEDEDDDGGESYNLPNFMPGSPAAPRPLEQRPRLAPFARPSAPLSTTWRGCASSLARRNSSRPMDDQSIYFGYGASQCGSKTS